MKNIIKETERLSLDEKPQMAESAPETDQVEEQKMEITPSKKRPFDQITNSEEKAKQPDGDDQDTKNELSSTSDQFQTAEGENLEKSEDKSCKRIKLSETPPKVDQLIQAQQIEKDEV